MWVIQATPETSKEHPNLRILPFPKKWPDAVWTLRYAGGFESGNCTIVFQLCFTTRNLRTKLCGIRSQTEEQEFVDPFKSWYHHLVPGNAC